MISDDSTLKEFQPCFERIKKKKWQGYVSIQYFSNETNVFATVYFKGMISNITSIKIAKKDGRLVQLKKSN